MVVKPYPSGRNIYCEIIPADHRIYLPASIGAGVTEAGFFTPTCRLLWCGRCGTGGGDGISNRTGCVSS